MESKEVLQENASMEEGTGDLDLDEAFDGLEATKDDE